MYLVINNLFCLFSLWWSFWFATQPLNRGESDISRKISQLRSKLRSVGSSFEKNSLLQEDELVDDTDEAAAPTLSGEVSNYQDNKDIIRDQSSIYL